MRTSTNEFKNGKLYIVAAIVHPKTLEVEIIIEKTVLHGILPETNTLIAMWIECESEMFKRELL